MNKQQNSNYCTLIGDICVDSSNQDLLVLPINITIVPLGVANGNKQGIPLSEKDNIMQSASMMPVRANFHNGVLYGHAGAMSIGTVREVYAEGSVIKSRAFIWKAYNEELVEYLLDVQTTYGSWEVMYDSSYIANDTEWLTGVLITGIALVRDPAYGRMTPATIATAQRFSTADISAALRDHFRHR